MSNAFFQVSLTEASLRTIERWSEAPEKVAVAVSWGLSRSLLVVENHLKMNLLRGGAEGQPRNGQLPLGTRTGRLFQAVTHEMRGMFEGVVGVLEGVTGAYARAMLGPDETVIRPKKKEHLWVPIGTNAKNPISPRDLMERKLPNGQNAAVIFKSKAGNMVVLLREGGTYKRGEKKGMLKGKLMYVLKKEVRLKPTNALARAFEDKEQEMAAAMNAEIENVFADLRRHR